MLPSSNDAFASALAGQYRLLREVGRGGMAVVYLADDLKHQRRVAVKAVRPEVSATLGHERFAREIAIAAHLSHPHILPLHDSGEAAGHLYFVMPYVDGESLRQRLQRTGPLTIADAVRIGTQVASALSYAHGQGVVHRDIKPENILLEEGEEAFVSDFGLARMMVSDGTPITETGLILGTPAYMSPEQVDGKRRVDGRADIYALGCVLYEALTGEPPFAGQTAQAILVRHLYDQPTRLSVLRAEIPPWLESLIANMLAKTPADRPGTASAVMHALVIGSSGSTTPLPRISSSRRVRHVVAAAMVTALVGVLAVPFLRARNARPLDVHRVMLYAPGQGEIGTTMLAALNSTAFIIVSDGDAALPAASGTGPSSSDMADVALRDGAAHWALVRAIRGDSLRLVLEQHHLPIDSVRRHVLAFPPSADQWTIGLALARALLADLLGSTRADEEIALLYGRSPAALAWYFEGERSYRRADFRRALAQFDTALVHDSLFAYAALRGAQAASWTDRAPDAGRLLAMPMARLAELPPRHAAFARGLDAYLRGRADSAVSWFEETVRLDARSVEGWMGLGETYTHLLPEGGALDSLAEHAFLRVRAVDSAFAPALVHLVEFATRRGDVPAARSRMAALAALGRDSSDAGHLELMVRCAAREPIDWTRAASEESARVTSAAQLLSSGGLGQPGCAIAAWNALALADTVGSHRFGILVARQAVLLASGRPEEARRAVESDTLFNLYYKGLLLTLDALAGAPFEMQADAFADSVLAWLRVNHDDVTAWDLSVAGSWMLRRDRSRDAAVLLADLERRAARPKARVDSLCLRSLAARSALASGDTADAIAKLRALRPTGDKAVVQWSPWESLGGERLLLAELLFATNKVEEAMRVARSLDAPARLLDVVYVPASLELRIRAAESWGDQAMARAGKARLLSLGVPQ